MQKPIIKKEILFIFIFVGLFGSILFCPIKMESGETCLLHKLLGSNTDHIHHKASTLEQNHHRMIQYIFPFGLIWWFSIFLLFSSSYFLKNSNQRRQYEN